MAIVNVEPLKNAVEHTADLNGRSYTVQLKAVVDNQATVPNAIRDFLAANGYLAGATYKWPLGVPTEEDFGSYLQRVRVAHASADGLTYDVTLEYASRNVTDDGPAQGTQVNNWIMAPWMARPTVRWTTIEKEVSLSRDRNGDPIVNRAGQPFDPQLTVAENVLCATITRVEQTFNPLIIPEYKDSVNDTEWFGWPPESVKCMGIEAEPFTDADWGLMYNVAYVFGFRPPYQVGEDKILPGWSVPVLNAGKMQLVGTKLVKIYDSNMQPVTEPVPLRNDGTWDVASTPLYIFWDIFKLREFADFNFAPNLFGPSNL